MSGSCLHSISAKSSAARNRVGRRPCPGTKLTIQKSVATKAIIMKQSKAFNGTLTDPEVIGLCGISRNTYSITDINSSSELNSPSVSPSMVRRGPLFWRGRKQNRNALFSSIPVIPSAVVTVLIFQFLPLSGLIDMPLGDALAGCPLIL